MAPAHFLRLSPSALFSTLVLGAVATLGCAPTGGECVAYNDCPAGEYCSSGSCVRDTVPDAGPFVPRDGGVVGNRDGGPQGDAGPAGNNAQLRTNFPVPWLQRDPANPQRILFAEQQVIDDTVTLDRVRSFDKQSLAIAPQPVYDLVNFLSGPCLADVIHIGLIPGETWFSCERAPPLRIVYDNDIVDPTTDYGFEAEVVLALPGSGGVNFPRVLAAPRGGAIVSFQVRSTDGLGQERFFDDVSVATSGVIAMFPLPGGSVSGSHVLLHDGRGQRLMPMTREVGTEQWIPAASLPVFTLPAQTHIAWLLGDISLTSNTTTPNEPNVMTIEPSTGLARYWNYETAQEILPFTRFEAQQLYLAEAPDAEERLLFDPAPSGNYVFYAVNGGEKIYRIPLTPGADTLVRQALIDDTQREITSLLAIDDSSVFVSYGNEELIERLAIIQPAL